MSKCSAFSSGTSSFIRKNIDELQSLLDVGEEFCAADYAELTGRAANGYVGNQLGELERRGIVKRVDGQRDADTEGAVYTVPQATVERIRDIQTNRENVMPCCGRDVSFVNDPVEGADPYRCKHCGDRHDRATIGEVMP